MVMPASLVMSVMLRRLVPGGKAAPCHLVDKKMPGVLLATAGVASHRLSHYLPWILQRIVAAAY